MNNNSLSQIKYLVKDLISIIRHPILSLKIKHKRGGYFIIGRNFNINNTRDIQFGRNIQICDNARFLLVRKYHENSYKPKVNIGDNVFIGFNFSLLAATNLTIEDNVLIASNVLITSENHGMNPTEHESYAQTPLEVKPVKIESGCWLGEKSIILPGVTLGKRCIVAAGAVVTKSYPDYCLLAGVPAKCIKRYNLNTNQWETV